MIRDYLIMVVVAAGLVSAAGLAAQAATISGQIKDADNRPVANATVSVGDKFDFTDVDGRYRVKDVPEGRRKMQIKKGDVILKESAVDIKGSGVRKDETVGR